MRATVEDFEADPAEFVRQIGSTIMWMVASSRRLGHSDVRFTLTDYSRRLDALPVDSVQRFAKTVMLGDVRRLMSDYPKLMMHLDRLAAAGNAGAFGFDELLTGPSRLLEGDDDGD